MGAWRDIIIALMIVTVMVFYPGGLWGVIQELRETFATLRAALMVRMRRRFERAKREGMLGLREEMVETKHGLIAVADTGPSDGHVGPPILLLHGNSACKEAFHNQFAHFRDRHRVIAFDLPGHGASDNGDPEETYNVIA